MISAKGLRTKELLAYLEGEVTRSEAEVIEEQLSESSSARRELAGLREMVEDLARPDEQLQRIDLVADLRRAVEASAARAPRDDGPARRWISPRLILSVAAGLLAIFGAALGWRLHGADEAPSAFRAKLAGGADAAAERWVNLRAFHTDRRSGAATPLGRSLPAGHALLFSYTNSGERPYTHLMVFAIDTDGRIFWYHPAYQRAGENPTAIPIDRGGEDVELKEAVEHDLGPGPLVVYGLFTRSGERVQAVEARVAALVRAGRWSAAAPPRLAFPGAAQIILKTLVTREEP